jgi:hypothetical protein
VQDDVWWGSGPQCSEGRTKLWQRVWPHTKAVGQKEALMGALASSQYPEGRTKFWRGVWPHTKETRQKEALAKGLA